MIWEGVAESSQEQSASIATRVIPTNVSTLPGASRKESITECGDDSRDRLLCHRYVERFDMRNLNCLCAWVMHGCPSLEDPGTLYLEDSKWIGSCSKSVIARGWCLHELLS